MVFTSALLSLFSSFLLADQGTTSAVFLKLEQGVRPIGMGGAYTAAADDVNSIMWNPAGLAKVPERIPFFCQTRQIFRMNGRFPSRTLCLLRG